MCSSKRSKGNGWSCGGGKNNESRNRSVNRFVIYDMDRKEWEKGKTEYLYSQRSQELMAEHVVPMKMDKTRTNYLS